MSLTVNQKESLKWLSQIAGADSSIAAVAEEIEHLEGHLEASRKRADVERDQCRTLEAQCQRLEVELEGAEERARLLLEAKDRWADRAQKAEEDALVQLARIKALEADLSALELEVEAIGEKPDA